MFRVNSSESYMSFSDNEGDIIVKSLDMFGGIFSYFICIKDV